MHSSRKETTSLDCTRNKGRLQRRKFSVRRSLQTTPPTLRLRSGSRWASSLIRAGTHTRCPIDALYQSFCNQGSKRFGASVRQRPRPIPFNFSQNLRTCTKVSASTVAFSVPFVLTCRLENRQVSFHL